MAFFENLERTFVIAQYLYFSGWLMPQSFQVIKPQVAKEMIKSARMLPGLVIACEFL